MNVVLVVWKKYRRSHHCSRMANPINWPGDCGRPYLAEILPAIPLVPAGVSFAAGRRVPAAPGCGKEV